MFFMFYVMLYSVEMEGIAKLLIFVIILLVLFNINTFYTSLYNKSENFYANCCNDNNNNNRNIDNCLPDLEEIGCRNTDREKEEELLLDNIDNIISQGNEALSTANCGLIRLPPDCGCVKN